MVRRIGVYWNSGKAHGLSAARTLMELARAEGMEALPDEALGRELGERGSGLDELAARCDAIVVLGGDGTMLAAAEPAARHGVPLLGVNIGHMGFMTEITPDALPEAVKRLGRGDFEIERRMMIQAECEGMPRQTALNDIVIYRPTDELHIVNIQLSVGGASLGRIMSDGLIVSTPTGSTAYSLSAGGPVVDPLLDCILVTPICPHSPLSRPAVLPDWERIEVATQAEAQSLLLSADSRTPVRLGAGARIEIARSDLRAGFIRFARRSFYDSFRMKISEWSN